MSRRPTPPIARCARFVRRAGCRRPRGPVRAPAVAALRKVTDDMLQACRADPTLDAPLVHALIAATDPETGQSISDDDIINDLLIFMLAGHDTTATALTYALWALGRHPDVQDRVADEARRLGDRELTPADVPGLGYTVQVLHEAMRLCPPAAGVGRLAVRDIAVDGHRVEAGSLVLVGIYAVHRDPTLWPQPLVFDPDRFSPEAARARDRWQFIPFAAGSRSCIGEHFARLETALALATIVRSTRNPINRRRFPCRRSVHHRRQGTYPGPCRRAEVTPTSRAMAPASAPASDTRGTDRPMSPPGRVPPAARRPGCRPSTSPRTADDLLS